MKPGLFRRRVSMSKVITFNVVTCWSTADFVPNYGAHGTGLLTGGGISERLCGLIKRFAYCKTKRASRLFSWCLSGQFTGQVSGCMPWGPDLQSTAGISSAACEAETWAYILTSWLLLVWEGMESIMHFQKSPSYGTLQDELSLVISSVYSGI